MPSDGNKISNRKLDAEILDVRNSQKAITTIEFFCKLNIEKYDLGEYAADS
jgi:hypothetical protein